MEIARGNTYILINGETEWDPDHLVFCRCHANINGMKRGSKCVLVPMVVDDNFRDFRASDICTTCYLSVDRPSNKTKVIHWCNQCGELMCDVCHDRVKSHPGERLTQLQQHTKREPYHWSWSGDPRHELSYTRLTSWQEGKCNRRHKTFAQIEDERQTPDYTYPYRTAANCWTPADIKAWQANASRSRPHEHSNRDDRHDYKRARRGR